MNEVRRTPPPGRLIGRLAALYRWPLKSAGGEAVQATRLGIRGLAGDRTHALFVDRKRGGPAPLTAREAPRLLAWSAAYEDHPGDHVALASPPDPVIVDPRGRRFAWRDERLRVALAEDLGRPVRLVRNTRGLPDLPDSVLITCEPSHREVQDRLSESLDLRRYRTNIHIDHDAGPFAEEDWEGRVMLIGDARVTLLHPCARCVIPARDPDTQEKHAGLLRWLFRERGGRFGINARAVRAARLAVGDPVYLV